MTLDEQIIACARDNGYDGISTLPKRKVNVWNIYYTTGDKDNPDGIWAWVVTDKQFKQWQRDYKLENILE